MIFALIVYFPIRNRPQEERVLEEMIYRSIRSILTQKADHIDLYFTGTTVEIELIQKILSGTHHLKPNFTFSISYITSKSDQNINLNPALELITSKIQNSSPTQKLIHLQIGDYFSGDFLHQSELFLSALGLHKGHIHPLLCLTDFKYLNQVAEVTSSDKILKTRLTEKGCVDLIFQPKLLIRPIQMLYDVKLLAELQLRFDDQISYFPLKLAKFNLDYILSLAKTNNFLLPELKFCPEAFYIASQELLDHSHLSSQTGWIEILHSKSDFLKELGGVVWWKYQWLYFWSRRKPRQTVET